MRKHWLAAAGAVTALTVGATIPALAQGDAPDAGTTDDPVTAEDWRAQRHQALADALSEKLGGDPSADEIADALADIRAEHRAERQATMRERLEERLRAAVEAGELTEEQMRALLDAHDAGVLGGPAGGPGFGHPGGRRGGPMHGGPMGGGPMGGPGFGGMFDDAPQSTPSSFAGDSI